MAESQGVPPSVYKNAINLNRYSNHLARKLIEPFGRIILNSVNELRAMDAAEYATSYRAQRLRAILGGLKTSLDGWAGDSSSLLKTSLTDLANIESEFALALLLKQAPGTGELIRELVISPQFAEAIVDADPTQINQFVLSDRLDEKVIPGQTFSLGAKDGATITLPNGQPLGRALRGISAKTADNFRVVVQDGLIAGESIDQITRKIVRSEAALRQYATAAKRGTRQYLLAGGQTGIANHQIRTLVRTSVTQVSNVASQKTYIANQEVTDMYRFVATLDSRTSLTCAEKDGKLYPYGSGPTPPLHFNCRSTTVAVVDWNGLKKKWGIQKPSDDAIRAGQGGVVPAKETYGKWLYDKRLTTAEGRYLGPGPEQIEALGKKKAVYFNRLAARKGSNGDKAIRKLVREDGTEKTLKQIVEENKLRPITSQKEIVTKVPLNVPTGMEPVALRTFDSPGAEDIAKRSGGSRKMVSDSLANLESLGGEAAENSRKMRRFIEQEKIFLNFSAPNESFNSSAWGARYLNDTLKETQKKAANFWKEAFAKIADKPLSKGGVGRASQGLMRRVTESGLLAKRLGVGDLDRLLHPCKGLTLGYTNSISGVVNSQIAYTGSTVTKAGAKKIQRDIQNMFTRIKAYRAGGSDPFYYEDLVPWSTSVPGKESVKTKWFSTIIHEVGHQVHFRAYQGGKLPRKYRKLGGDNLTGRYATKDDDELFAESFTHYVLSPESLKKNAPQLYAWVDDAMTILFE